MSICIAPSRACILKPSICIAGRRRNILNEKEQTPESGIPPNIAQKVVTPKIHLPIWVSSATLIGQLATVTIFGAILGGISHFGFSVWPSPLFGVILTLSGAMKVPSLGHFQAVRNDMFETFALPNDQIRVIFSTTQPSCLFVVRITSYVRIYAREITVPGHPTYSQRSHAHHNHSPKGYGCA